MSAFLRIHPDPQSPPRDVASIAQGSTIVVGRSLRCDVPFPDDTLMSSRHLAIKLLADQCILEDLGSTNGTTLNGSPIQSANAQPGDTFTCGTTTLSIEWPRPSHPPRGKPSASTGQASAVAAKASAAATTAAPSPSLRTPAHATSQPTTKLPPELEHATGFLLPTADPILARFKLRQTIPLTPENNESPLEFVRRIPKPADQIHFLAFALHNRPAILWLATATKLLPDLAPEESQTLELVQHWLQQPSEKLRRQIHAAADPTNPQRPLKWLGNSVFFASGSITPPDSPFLAPDPAVAHQAVHAGLVILSLLLAPTPPGSLTFQQSLVNLALESISS